MATFEKRKTSDGKIKHRALIRLKGYPPQSATFDRLTDAKDWARQQEAEMKRGRHFKDAEAKKHTLADLIDRYLKQVKRDNPQRYPEVKLQLEYFKRELGYLILADLTKRHISEALDKLAAQAKTRKDGTIAHLSPARINRYMAALSHAFSIAENEWEWLEQNPMRKIRRKQEPRGRVRYLNDEERNRLMMACQEAKNDMLYIVTVMALSTGARKNEIMTLRWQDIELERQMITLHETKNGERRVLVLTGHAHALMCEHARKTRKNDKDFVFPAPHNPTKPWNMRSAWLDVVKKAELENFRFHDLRHSAASYLAMGGATTAEIAEVLGHKTLSMVKRYAHLSQPHTQSVVARMNENIFGKQER